MSTIEYGRSVYDYLHSLSKKELLVIIKKLLPEDFGDYAEDINCTIIKSTINDLSTDFSVKFPDKTITIDSSGITTKIGSSGLGLSKNVLMLGFDSILDIPGHILPTYHPGYDPEKLELTLAELSIQYLYLITNSEYVNSAIIKDNGSDTIIVTVIGTHYITNITMSKFREYISIVTSNSKSVQYIIQ